jgi:hypothetical protein
MCEVLDSGALASALNQLRIGSLLDKLGSSDEGEVEWIDWPLNIGGSESGTLFCCANALPEAVAANVDAKAAKANGTNRRTLGACTRHRQLNERQTSFAFISAMYAINVPEI